MLGYAGGILRHTRCFTRGNMQWFRSNCYVHDQSMAMRDQRYATLNTVHSNIVCLHLTLEI
jgi:hypothetical protein